MQNQKVHQGSCSIEEAHASILRKAVRESDIKASVVRLHTTPDSPKGLDAIATYMRAHATESMRMNHAG
jgi:hypothetical protein